MAFNTNTNFIIKDNYTPEMNIVSNNSSNLKCKSLFTLNNPQNNFINANDLNNYLNQKNSQSRNEFNHFLPKNQILSYSPTPIYPSFNGLRYPKYCFDINNLKPIKDCNLEYNESNQIKNKELKNIKLIKPIFLQDNIEIEKNTEQENQNNEKIETLKNSNQSQNPNLMNKFKVLHFKEKIKLKLKHKRKYKPDDIRKKIKARFHKSIKNIINENLKQAGSKHFFSFLPQIFISSISREVNNEVLNLTYKELIQKDFLNNIDAKKYKNKIVDLNKYKNNLNVLDYLDKNPDISKKSGFDIISKMKYSDLLNEYFNSKEFNKAIIKLREENEEEDYINEYINKAKSYVRFFTDLPMKYKIKNNN